MERPSVVHPRRNGREIILVGNNPGAFQRAFDRKGSAGILRQRESERLIMGEANIPGRIIPVTHRPKLTRGERLRQRLHVAEKFPKLLVMFWQTLLFEAEREGPASRNQHGTQRERQHAAHFQSARGGRGFGRDG